MSISTSSSTVSPLSAYANRLSLRSWLFVDAVTCVATAAIWGIHPARWATWLGLSLGLILEVCA